MVDGSLCQIGPYFSDWCGEGDRIGGHADQTEVHSQHRRGQFFARWGRVRTEGERRAVEQRCGERVEVDLHLAFQLHPRGVGYQGRARRLAHIEQEVLHSDTIGDDLQRRGASAVRQRHSDDGHRVESRDRQGRTTELGGGQGEGRGTRIQHTDPGYRGCPRRHSGG